MDNQTKRQWHNIDSTIIIIKFQDIQILSTVPGYMDRTVREAVVVELFPNHMKREDGVTFTGNLKERKKTRPSPENLERWNIQSVPGVMCQT